MNLEDLETGLRAVVIYHHVEALEEISFLITLSWSGGTIEERHDAS
jgi:hypothetical protein